MTLRKIRRRNTRAGWCLLDDIATGKPLLAFQPNAPLADVECAATLLMIGFEPRHVAEHIAMPAPVEPGSPEEYYGGKDTI